MSDALTVTIDGNDRSNKVRTDPNRRTVKVSLALSGSWQATLPVFDEDAETGYRADTEEELLIDHDDAGRVFKGKITDIDEGPLDPDGDEGVLQALTARAMMPITDQVQDITVTYAAGMTRKEVLEALVDDYLSDFGITLDPTITDGDDMPELAFDGVSPKTILDQISTITGEVWRLTPDDVLQMFLIGEKTSSFSLNETNAGAVRVRKTMSQFLNRATLKAGPSAQLAKAIVITADGIASSWVVSYTPVSDGAGWIVVSDPLIREDVGAPASAHTLSAPGGGGQYEFDPLTNTLTRTFGVPSAGREITFTPVVQYPITVVAEDAASIAAHGLWSKKFQDVNITDIDTAEQTAAGLLATGLEQPREVNLMTSEGFVLPGTTIPLEFPKRLITGDWVVVKVDIADFEEDLLEYSYTLQDGDRTQGTFTNQMRERLQGTTSGAVSISTAGIVSPTVLSAPVMLGGTDQTSFAAADWTRVPNTSHYFPKASYTGRLTVEVWRRSTASIGITVRLYNVTDDAAAMTTSEITSATAHNDTEVIGAIVADKEYELQFKVTTGSGGGAFINGAQLEAA